MKEPRAYFCVGRGKIIDKALEMGKTSTLGSVHLFLGTSISTIIMAIGTIVLGLFILPTDYGLYAVALIPSTTLALFHDWGVGPAITRYCAKYRATGEALEQKKVIIAGLIFLGVVGLVLALITLFSANLFASIYNKPASGSLIALTSITVFSGGVASAAASTFTGFEMMKLNSYLAIVAAVVQSVLASMLVVFGFGAEGAVIGFTAASVVQATVSVIFLYTFLLRKLPNTKTTKFEIIQTLKSLLHYGVPLGISSILSGLGTPLFSFLMATYVSEAMIGNYKIASNFTILLTFLTVPISDVLFPAFSKIDPKKEKGLLKTIFSSSVKYTVLLLVPATMLIAVLATPLVGTLYANKWAAAPEFLALSVVFNLLSLTGLRSMSSLLSAVGETKLQLKMSILSLAIAIPAAFLLVPSLGIIGIIIGLPIAALPSAFVGLYVIWKRYGAKADFGSSAKVLFASTLATASVYLVINFFNAPYLVLLVAGSILFLSIYLVSAPLVDAINQSDIINLRAMFSGVGILSRIMEIPLKIMQKILEKRDTFFRKNP